MKELSADLWDIPADWYGVTTNGVVDSRGDNTMGRGIALEAKQRYPELPTLLGRRLSSEGNRVFLFEFPNRAIITFPTKNHWRHPSLISLIKESCQQLVCLVNRKVRSGGSNPKIVLPRPGCGTGGLNWEEVKPILEVSFKTLDIITAHKE